MKIFQFISVLFSYLFFITGQLYSQDILYKKDSTSVKVVIKGFDGKTVLYQIPGDSPGRLHYLSKSMIDSVIYGNGESLNLFPQNKELHPHILQIKQRNYISVDIFNLAFKNPNIWYERMSKNGRTSFVAELLINFNPKQQNAGWNGNDPLQYYNFTTHYFFTRLGISYCPYNYSVIKTGDTRLFNGLSVIFGSYRKITWETSSYSHYPVFAAGFAASLMYDLSCRISLNDHMQIKGGLNISLLPLFTYVCPEIGISIGF
jgi:hypothetical protein